MKDNEKKIRIIQEGQEIRGGVNGIPTTPRPSGGPPANSPSKGQNRGR